jgi:hypothetical protein
MPSCGEMDDNYKDYLTNRVYSPKIQNLSATNGYKECTLKWDNPSGNIAKTIEVHYDDEVLSFATMIDSLVITDLEIKGYSIQVYTIDNYGNNSVPSEAYIFPSGE